MTIKHIKIDSTSKKALLAIAGVACALAAWQFSRWGMANSAATRAADVEVATYLTQLAPSDPGTHYAAAVFLEKSFDPEDVRQALYEHEQAVALSPHNYLLWLELGRARERSGDAEGAEVALRRALELAPSYSRVQWALGNALLRQGRIEEAFAEIRKAVVGDPTFAAPAATTAWQFFDGDVSAIRRSMAGSTGFESALTGLLAREKKFEEALEIWSGIPVEEKKTVHKETAALLANKLLEEKKFRSAMGVLSEIAAGETRQPGQITNGGFESAVKTEGAGVFDWQIAGGFQPQIVLSGGQRHGGSNSLFMIFNSSDGKDFRSVSQTVAVEPGAAYELEIFYRSDLKTPASLRWEVADAADGKRLAVTDPVTPRSEWTALRATFKVPAPSDGIVIRFIREDCGTICPMNGNLWFDDVSIRQTAR